MVCPVKLLWLLAQIMLPDRGYCEERTCLLQNLAHNRDSSNFLGGALGVQCCGHCLLQQHLLTKQIIQVVIVLTLLMLRLFCLPNNKYLTPWHQLQPKKKRKFLLEENLEVLDTVVVQLIPFAKTWALRACKSLQYVTSTYRAVHLMNYPRMTRGQLLPLSTGALEMKKKSCIFPSQKAATKINYNKIQFQQKSSLWWCKQVVMIRRRKETLHNFCHSMFDRHPCTNIQLLSPALLSFPPEN